MKLFAKLFKRKRSQSNVSTLPNKNSETINDEQLNYKDNLISITYNSNKTYRYVILQSDKNYLTYHLEALCTYDEEEMNYFPTGTSPTYWQIIDRKYKPIFENIDELMKELKAEPEYKNYFITE